MPVIAVNVIKVLFALALYGFLFYVARAMRSYVAGPGGARRPPPAPGAGAAPRAPSRPAALEVATGDEPPRLVTLSGRLVVGRGSAADVRIDDEFSSALHAAFEERDGAVWVEDLGSTNGTTVDGIPVVGRALVAPGSAVVLGGTTVTVR